MSAQPSAASADPGRSLGDLIADLAVIDVVRAPAGLGVMVTDVVIYDPVAPPPIEAGALVLGVGVDASQPSARDLIATAADAGAAGVVVRVAEGLGALGDVAESKGVALLALPPEMTWAQTHSLVRTAGATPDASGETSVDGSGVVLGDLFALANAVAAMVGGAVTIEDRHSRVLAYSSQDAGTEGGIDEPRRRTILGRRVPDDWLERLEEAGVFRRLWAGEVVRYEAEPGFDLLPRLALAVRAGEIILGSIWVSEGKRRLGPEAEDALREAARIAALHLIRHRNAEDLDRTARSESLRALLESRGPVDAIAYRLGLPPRGQYAIVAFEPEARDEIEDALALERILDLVTLYGEAFRQRSAGVHIGHTIYVLLPAADAERPERLVEIASDIVERARDSLGVTLRAGVGSIVGHLRDAQRSRSEADQVLRALATGEGSGVADFEAARVRVALMELRDFVSDHPHLRSMKLRRLADHDADHATRYVETLRVFLDSLGDVPRAAQAANVHPNTLRYRLRRLVQVGGINLGDPDERLLLSIDLRLGESE